jgi:hypothetical protein
MSWRGSNWILNCSLAGRRKTWQDVERTSALNVAKGNYLEVIKALQEGKSWKI